MASEVGGARHADWFPFPVNATQKPQNSAPTDPGSDRKTCFNVHVKEHADNPVHVDYNLA